MSGTTLPREFEQRFVVGQGMILLPLLLVAFAWKFAVSSSPVVAVATSAVYIAIAFAVPLMFVRRRRLSLEYLIRMDVGDPDSAKTHIFPMSAAIATLAAVLSLLKHDVRYALIPLVMGLLLAVGIGLRWFLYDRWLEEVIRRGA